MVNQAVGDALSNILLVETALAQRHWPLQKLAELYDDLPSCMLKVLQALMLQKPHPSINNSSCQLKLCTGESTRQGGFYYKQCRDNCGDALWTAAED